MDLVKIGPKAGLSLAKPEGKHEDSGLFGDLLAGAIRQAEDLEKAADNMAIRLAAGEVEDLHEVVIATEKARIGFELAIQIRNKALEAYQEIMRMQV